jgi:DNA-binding NtrC family response regulator
LRLFVIGEKSFSTHRIPDTGALTIGSGAGCDLVVSDASVAPRHARLSLGPPLALEDLGSGLATQLGEERLAPGETAEVPPGDPIQLGNVLLMVERRRGAPPRRFLSRDYFEQRLEEECHRGERSQTVFSVLRIAASAPGPADAIEQVIAGELRMTDVIALHGPGEYAVLLCETPAAGAEVLISRLKARLGGAGAQLGFGIACYPRDGHDAFMLIAAAAPPGVVKVKDEVPADLPEYSLAMLQLRGMVERVAASDLSVLILGETGVGKERMAEEIHRRSGRSDKPIMRLNCAALSESLLESELFGHERGAFTGAHERKTGLFEAAQGGTVFLDEVGDMPLPTQVKLLRVLEERQVRRVGSTTSLDLDVRFVSATNRDLERAIARGTFREDLYFRLNGITFVIPPLRERTSEIEELARRFVAEASKRYGVRKPPEIPAETLTLLREYAWPGNIRELRSVIERAVVLCDAGPLTQASLPLEKMRAHFAPRDAPPPPAPQPPASKPLLAEDQRRREELIVLLQEHRGNVTAVARALDKARFQVQRWLKRYGIDAAVFR